MRRLNDMDIEDIEKITGYKLSEKPYKNNRAYIFTRTKDDENLFDKTLIIDMYQGVIMQKMSDGKKQPLPEAINFKWLPLLSKLFGEK